MVEIGFETYSPSWAHIFIKISLIPTHNSSFLYLYSQGRFSSTITATIILWQMCLPIRILSCNIGNHIVIEGEKKLLERYFYFMESKQRLKIQTWKTRKRLNKQGSKNCSQNYPKGITDSPPCCPCWRLHHGLYWTWTCHCHSCHGTRCWFYCCLQNEF